MMSYNLALQHRPDEAASTVCSPNAPDAALDVIDIDTRFGRIRFDRRRDISMPRGMPGFPGIHLYGIAGLPDPRFAQFLVLQSLERPTLSFLLLPEASPDLRIEPEHRSAAARDLGIAEDDLALAFVVAIRKAHDGAEISVNLRAPLLVDVPHRSAWQHILPYGDYSVRHLINREGSREPGQARPSAP